MDNSGHDHPPSGGVLTSFLPRGQTDAGITVLNALPFTAFFGVFLSFLNLGAGAGRCLECGPLDLFNSENKGSGGGDEQRSRSTGKKHRHQEPHTDINLKH